jgi:hypothetical protein
MAELTKLESKLGEVTGLAMAAQAATKKVSGLAKGDADELVPKLEQMNQEASETEQRCTELAGSFDGKKTAILEEAAATKAKGAEMMATYLDADSDANAGHAGIAELVEWALPIQQGHLQGVMEASVTLAGEEDPSEPA